MVDYGTVREYFELKELPTYEHIKDGVPRTEMSVSTANALELDLFYKSFLPTPRTTTGATMLAHSFISPPKDVATILARQEAVRELKEKEGLREKLEYTLNRVGYVEGSALALVKGGFYESSSDILSARELINISIGELGSLGEIESPYLRERVERLKGFKGSDIHRLSNETIYRQGFKTPLHARQLNLALFPFIVPNTLASSKPLTGAFFAAVTGLSIYGASNYPSLDEAGRVMIAPVIALGAGAVGVASAFLAGAYERAISIPPLKRKLRGDDGARASYSSFGVFDEILSLAKFAKSMEDKGHKMTLPTIIDSDRQRVSCDNLVNLVQAADKKYVPNRNLDFGSGRERLSFITGPNSGGKTSFSKALATLQILGQMGSYVPASSAVLSPADRIIYQVGINDSQKEGEGGYGTQLRQTREILETADPRSLVVIDDLMSGTEEEAMARQTKNQFYALQHTGANVIVITHRHDLAKEFRSQTGKGNYLQMEFEGDNPTRQIVPGIAPTSRPELVESRVNMGQEGVEKLLRERGFLRHGQGLYDIDTVKQVI